MSDQEQFRTLKDTNSMDTTDSPLQGNLIQSEIFLLNGKPFDELITRTDAKHIWTKVLDRELSDLMTIDLAAF